MSPLRWEVEVLVDDRDPVVRVHRQQVGLVADQRQPGPERLRQRGQVEPADPSAVVDRPGRPGRLPRAGVRRVDYPELRRQLLGADPAQQRGDRLGQATKAEHSHAKRQYRVPGPSWTLGV